jgi:hypothetical protein
MTPHRYTTALAAALILLPGAAAAAESSQQRWNQVFEQLDQDRDGALSRAEYERANSLQISAAPGRNPYLPESSQTGASSTLIQIPYLVLVPNPYMNLNPASPPGASGQPQAASAPIPSGSSTQLSSLVAFDTLDADRNGYITAVEALRSYPLFQAWNKVDMNRDGQVERAEFSAFEQGAPR